MKRVIRRITFGLLASTMLIGCGGKGGVDKVDNSVIASNYPMYAFTKMIAGDSLEVVNLVPPGVEPHDWEPSVRDITKLEEGKAFVYNGAGMELWVNKVLESLENKDLLTLEASKGVKLIRLDSEVEEDHHEEHEHHHEEYDMIIEEHEHEHEHCHEHSHEHEHEHEHHHHDHDHDHDEHHHEHHHGCGHSHGEWDPHVFLSLRAAQIELKNIKGMLEKVKPEDKELYEKNYNRVIKELKDLDNEYKEKLAPYAGKSIVVAHEAFAYMCRDYNLHQLGIEGVFADSEPSPAKMKEIIDFVRENNIKVIFFESLASPKVAEAIAKETGATTAVLNPLEGLTEEELKAGENYLSIMKKNLKALEEALIKE